MTIAAQYTNAEKTNCNVRLEPGDHLASLNVQAPFTTPAFIQKGYRQPEVRDQSGNVIVEAHDVPDREVPEQVFEGGQPTVFSVPCNDDNPPWVELLRRIEAGEVAPIKDADPPPAPVVVVSKLELYRRMTDQEAQDVEDLLDRQTVKNRRLYNSAETFRSDAPEWALLNQMAHSLFTEERVGQLLAPSA